MNAWRTGTGISLSGSTVRRWARILGSCHQVAGEAPAGRGSETGVGMEAIALQPSGASPRLPAVEAFLTIPRHAGPRCGTGVARLRAPRHARPRGASCRGPPHAVLRLRPDRAQPA